MTISAFCDFYFGYHPDYKFSTDASEPAKSSESHPAGGGREEGLVFGCVLGAEIYKCILAAA